MSRPHFRFEKALATQGVWPVAGIDEAGRGPLAGPVSAAAVILDPRKLPKGLDDSKKLSAEEREAAFDLIMQRAVAVGIGLACAHEIDRINIRQATFLAMRRALAALALSPAHALIDGNAMPDDLCCPAQTIIKGDAKSLSIAAASIVAKVTRDRLMTRLHRSHPQYGFHEHVGYPTPAHLGALATHGPCIFHRRSFAPVRAHFEQTIKLELV
jgi:ribonuclease HII